MSPFCGATDTPVLDFWWRLPWVSKPGWIPRLRASSPAHIELCLVFRTSTYSFPENTQFLLIKVSIGNLISCCQSDQQFHGYYYYNLKKKNTVISYSSKIFHWNIDEYFMKENQLLVPKGIVVTSGI